MMTNPSTEPITKTEAREVVAAIRRETLALKSTLSPGTPKWVLQELGVEAMTPETTKALVAEHIKDIEDLLDQLRRYSES